MQTVVELPTFIRQAEAIFSPEERVALIDYLAAYPLLGDEIPGTGGVRKLRFAASGRGKRGGARVIYYWYSEDAPIYALLVYAKNVRTDLSPAERKTVAAIAKAIKQHQRSR
ncbi:MAG TPA: type II toxin-antitoxin system RelE/ParE family toxin [Shinella sp.]|nr:type II toxin-antitoxin system RelE/ParE family toxin [Shinella sp.]